MLQVQSLGGPWLAFFGDYQISLCISKNELVHFMGPRLIFPMHFTVILQYHPYLISHITKNPWERGGASCKL